MAAGEVVAVLHVNNELRLAHALELAEAAIEITSEPVVSPLGVVLDRIG